jgi:cell division protein FtsB
MTEEQALRQAIKRLAKENEKLKSQLTKLATDILVREMTAGRVEVGIQYIK